jgi:hypothetical protein
MQLPFSRLPFPAPKKNFSFWLFRAIAPFCSYLTTKWLFCAVRHATKLYFRPIIYILGWRSFWDLGSPWKVKICGIILLGFAKIIVSAKNIHSSIYFFLFQPFPIITQVPFLLLLLIVLIFTVIFKTISFGI